MLCRGAVRGCLGEDAEESETIGGREPLGVDQECGRDLGTGERSQLCFQGVQELPEPERAVVSWMLHRTLPLSPRLRTVDGGSTISNRTDRDPRENPPLTTAAIGSRRHLSGDIHVDKPRLLRGMPVTGRAREPEREHRISMEIVVDAYDSGERAMGWYYYLQDTIV